MKFINVDLTSSQTNLFNWLNKSPPGMKGIKKYKYDESLNVASNLMMKGY